MKRIVLDMDGIVVNTRRISHLPNILIWTVLLLFHWVFLFFPSRVTDPSYFQQYEVYIVSHRPKFCTWVTKLWFRIRKYPVRSVHCIGLNGDKCKLAEKIKPDVIIDDRLPKTFGDKKPIDLFK